MPILILGALVIIGVLVYMFITSNHDQFVRGKEDVHGPFDVIYLPADLEEEKRRDEARRTAAAQAAEAGGTDSGSDTAAPREGGEAPHGGEENDAGKDNG